eukprot:Sspe_Gene.62762::Locus_35466_Transcript_1_1_Confidence_1.000_Length_615::g.62762::m.62762
MCLLEVFNGKCQVSLDVPQTDCRGSCTALWEWVLAAMLQIRLLDTAEKKRRWSCQWCLSVSLDTKKKNHHFPPCLVLGEDWTGLHCFVHFGFYMSTGTLLLRFQKTTKQPTPLLSGTRPTFRVMIPPTF